MWIKTQVGSLVNTRMITMIRHNGNAIVYNPVNASNTTMMQLGTYSSEEKAYEAYKELSEWLEYAGDDKTLYKMPTFDEMNDPMRSMLKAQKG